jgi:hypothetical protein
MKLTEEEIKKILKTKILPVKWSTFYSQIYGMSIVLILFLQPLYFIVKDEFQWYLVVISSIGFIVSSILAYRIYLTLILRQLPIYFNSKENSIDYSKHAIESLGWSYRESSNMHMKANTYMPGEDMGTFHFYIFYDKIKQYSVCINDMPGLSLHINVHLFRKQYESRIKRLYYIEKNRYYNKKESLPTLNSFENLIGKDVDLIMQILRVSDIDAGYPPFKIKAKIEEIYPLTKLGEFELMIRLNTLVSGKTINMVNYKEVSLFSLKIYPKYVRNFLDNEEVLSEVKYFRQYSFNKGIKENLGANGEKRSDGVLITYDGKIRMN